MVSSSEILRLGVLRRRDEDQDEGTSESIRVRLATAVATPLRAAFWWCTLGANEANFTQSVTATVSSYQQRHVSGKPFRSLDMRVVECGPLLVKNGINY